jgi:hypothetical protein
MRRLFLNNRIPDQRKKNQEKNPLKGEDMSVGGRK